MEFTKEDWEALNIHQDTCRHSMIGSCVDACVWCGVTGFYLATFDKNRLYRICKWCLTFQNVGKKEQKLYFEVCYKCFPDPKPELNENGQTVIRDSEDIGFRITQFPGHPCPDCNSTMEIFQPKENVFTSYYKELNDIHMYDL